MWILKKQTTKNLTKQKQSHRYREQTGGCQGGGGTWEKQVREIKQYYFPVTK